MPCRTIRSLSNSHSQVDLPRVTTVTMTPLKGELRALHGSSENDTIGYKSLLLLLFLLRFLCIFTAWNGMLKLTVLISSLQFLIAPYSLFVSFTLAVALFPPIYASHYLSYFCIQSVGSILYSIAVKYQFTNILWFIQVIEPVCSIRVSIWFVLTFFVIDQLSCMYFHFLTPSKSFSTKDFFTHAVWGFLNTKTYHVVLLFHLLNGNFQISLVVWCIDICLGLTDMLAKAISHHWMHWAELFYSQHRIGHLPKVYEHAHKLHHYLHGTNAFDAHIYGNGMPEEYFVLMLEVVMALACGMTPASLNYLILSISWGTSLAIPKNLWIREAATFTLTTTCAI